MRFLEPPHPMMTKKKKKKKIHLILNSLANIYRLLTLSFEAQSILASLTEKSGAKQATV